MNEDRYNAIVEYENKIDLNDGITSVGNDFDWTCPHCGYRNAASDCWEYGPDQYFEEHCSECNEPTQFSASWSVTYDIVIPEEMRGY